jgi:hypothetical protein
MPAAPAPTACECCPPDAAQQSKATAQHGAKKSDLGPDLGPGRQMSNVQEEEGGSTDEPFFSPEDILTIALPHQPDKGLSKVSTSTARVTPASAIPPIDTGLGSMMLVRRCSALRSVAQHIPVVTGRRCHLPALLRW